MRRFCLLTGCLALALLPAALHGAPSEPAADNSAPVAVKDASAAMIPAAPAGATHSVSHARSRSGQWIHVDPKTGRLTDRPTAAAAPGARREPSAASLSTSTEGLQAIPIPAGGILVDLKGRFRSTLVATVDKDGRLTIRHEGATSREKE